MRSLGARWYLFGAQSVAVWGRARMTADVDVTADVAPSRIRELLRIVITKLIAGRPRDKEDVRGILAERGEELDGVYLRQTLAMIEPALDRSDLLASLEELGEWQD